MRYDLATLTIRLGRTGRVVAAVGAWSQAEEARGELLGAWASEIGNYSELTLLRGFADEADMYAERWRTLASSDPFGCGGEIVGMRFDSYAPFPWLPPIVPGRYGDVYELRTYKLKHGGVPATIAAWETAIEKRVRYSPLIVAMYALDGPPRFTHIWPYKSQSERQTIRAEILTEGVWPPKGATDWLTGEIETIIVVPTMISQLT